MTYLFCRIAPLLVSAILLQPAEAVSEDENRVLAAYNSNFDSCRGVDKYTGLTAKLAADKMCEQAFQALDRLRKNSCDGWHHAECRYIEGEPHFQCTCFTTECNELAVRVFKPTPFRDCANHLWTQELNTQVVPAPTPDFQQLRGYYDDTWELARITSSLLNPGQYEGGASRPNYSGGIGTSGGVGTSGGFGTPGGASPSGDGYIPNYVDFCGPSYDPYGEGGSQGAIIPSSNRKSGTSYPSYAPMEPGNLVNSSPGGPTTSYACPICSNKYGSLHEIGEHMKSHPAVPPKGRHPLVRPQEGGRFKCTDCGRTYSLKRALLAHEKSHTSLETYCVFCDQTFVSRPSYQSHMRLRHPEILKSQAVAKTGPIMKVGDPSRHYCSSCERSYRNKRALRAHEKSHNTQEAYCSSCKKNFASKASHREHMERRHPEKLKAELAAAREKRSEEETERCMICGKGYKIGTRGLIDHMAVHDGATKCDICGATLSRVSALNEHKKSIHKVKHTGKRSKKENKGKKRNTRKK